MKISLWVATGACALACVSCAKDKEEKYVHSEVMVIKKDGAEKKETVQDPLDQGVKREVQRVYPDGTSQTVSE